MSSCEVNQMLEYIYDLKVYRDKPSFNNILKILELLGNPQKNLKIIHIAGTNGKGSTSNYIASILKESNYKVGLFTSPHLVKFNERIRINEEFISDFSIMKYVNHIKNIIENYNKEIRYNLDTNKINTKIELSFFEFITCLALFYFKNRNVDFVVLETGVGGLWDPTNCINSIICGITNVSLDHTKILGNNIEEIALKKSRIIKSGTKFFTSEKNEKIIEIFKKQCLKSKVNYVNVKDFSKEIKTTIESQKWTYSDGNNEFEVETLMNGIYQIDNANLAIAICLELSKKYLNINLKSIIKGVKLSKWDGRLEVFNLKHKIIIDGAHNSDAFDKMKKFIEMYESSYSEGNKSKYKFKTVIVAFSDKEKVKCFVEKLGDLFVNIIITKGDYKASSVDDVFEIFNKKLKGVNLFKFENSLEAIDFALNKIEYLENEMILVTGSLYMIGNIREWLIKEKKNKN